MKKIIFMATILFSLASFAQTNGVGVKSTNDTEAKAKIEAVFPQRKAVALKVIEDREKILLQEKTCVTKSANTDQLKHCFFEASQTRKQMANELKAKFPPKKENKEVKK